MVSLRIAILVPSLHGGGAEFVAREWGRYLEAVGHRVTFLTTHGEPQDGSVSVPGRWFGSRLVTLRRCLRTESFDHIIALGPHWNLLAILASRSLRARPKISISGRTIEIEANRAGNNKTVELVLARLFYRFTDGFIAISHATAAEAQGHFGIPMSKIWIIPNPALGKIDFAQVRSRFAELNDTPEDGALEIVVPGRLTRSKRPELAISVAERCAEITGKFVRVHYFGTGPAESLVQTQRPRSVEVNIHGWVEHWFDRVPKGSVVLLTSRIEGFANVLVEATARRLVTIASSRALGVSDAIIPGVTGLLVLSDSVEEYARSVIDAQSMKPPSVVVPWLSRFTANSSGGALVRMLASLRSSSVS